MVIQEIEFLHQPSQIRAAAAGLVGRRLKEPSVVLAIAALFLLLLAGIFTSYTWFLVVPIAAYTAMLLFFLQYILNSPRIFCGVEVHMSVREDGVHFSGANRSGMVRWAGFREIYVLNSMWAVFVKNSDAVTYIPTDRLNRETLDFMVAKLRENEVKIQGECP